MKTATKTQSKRTLQTLAVIPAEKFRFEMIANTGLAGYVKTSYDMLLLTFGAPTRRGSPDNKIGVEWVLRVGTTVATIYDYKGDCPISDAVAEWHIGGSAGAVEMVAALTGFETREAH